LAEARREASPVLIAAADSGLEAAEAAGIRPGWILGDMDSLDDPARLAVYPAERVLRFPRAKDDTDTELALRLLRDQGCDELWIAGGGGGRTDHLLALRALFEQESPPRRWLTAREDIRLLDAEAGAGELSLACRRGTPVSVFPLGQGPWKAGSEGLRWPLEPVAWERGRFSLSNETDAGSFCIRALAGRFLALVLQRA
jgi:thiamine pyrophosphokinase